MNVEKTENLDGTTYKLTHYYDPKECYDTVKFYCEKYWNMTSKTTGKENYMFGDGAVSWSIGPMLLNNGFEGGFTILEVDGSPWSFAGIRRYNDDTSLVLCRTFCFHTVKPITHGMILPMQLSISKELGFKKAWFTLNRYNHRLYETVWKPSYYKNKNEEVYARSKNYVETSKYLGEHTINNTAQIVLGWDL